MRRIRKVWAGALLACSLLAPMAANAGAAKQPANGYPDFALGADVSWYTRVNNTSNYAIYNGPSTSDGVTTQKDVCADYGLDAIRLRVWVNPSNSLVKDGFSVKISSTITMTNTLGYDDPDDVLAIARALSANGHRFMIAFHMSDTWADPARQFVPAEWASCASVEEVKEKMVEHVQEVLQACYDYDINVAWVQIGNETNTGMLQYTLPSASGGTATAFAYAAGISSSGADNFVTYFNACYDAAKEIYPDCKVLYQHGAGCDTSRVPWAVNILKKAGIKMDLVGLSCYPLDDDHTASWSTNTANLITNINTLSSTYGYKSIICEMGMNNDWSDDSSDTSQSGCIAQCNEDVTDFTEYLIENLGDASKCEGLFWWEPLADHFDGYKMAAVYDIEGNWSRSKVTPNAWWDVIKANSTFPAGGLVDFTLGGGSGENPETPDTPVDDAAPLYIAYSDNWTPTNPATFTHDATTGLYTATVTAYEGYDNTWWIQISTAASTEAGADSYGYDKGNGEFEAASIYPTGAIVNGETTVLDGTGNSFMLPYAATWTITVNLDKMTINCYTTTPDPNAVEPGIYSADSEFATISIYNWADSSADTFYEMTSEDGNSYYYAGAPGLSGSNSWWNFQIVQGNWEAKWGGKAVAKETEVALTKSSSSNNWLNNWTVTSDYYWWFNLETGILKITTSSTSPWELKPTASITYTAYSVTYNNGSTQWPAVFAYVLDADGNELCGAWPGKRLDLTSSNTDNQGNYDEIWTLAMVIQGTPATVQFSNGGAEGETEEYIDGHQYGESGQADASNYVLFDNTKAQWGTVYAYAFTYDSTTDVTTEYTGTWPGTAMSVYDAENNLYRISLGNYKPAKIIFTNGDEQTNDLDYVAGNTYTYTPVDPNALYLVGTFCTSTGQWDGSWVFDDQYKFATEDDDVYTLTGVDFASSWLTPGFKIANADWSLEYGFNTDEVDAGTATGVTVPCEDVQLYEGGAQAWFAEGNYLPANATITFVKSTAMLTITVPEVVISSMYFLNEVEGMESFTDDRKMTLDEATGCYCIPVSARIDHFQHLYFVANGDWNAKYGQVGLYNGEKTTFLLVEGDDSFGWNQSDLDEWNTVWFDPATKEAWVEGDRVLYLACEENAWLADEDGSVPNNEWRLTHDGDGLYHIGSVTLGSWANFSFADRAWSVRYTTGDLVATPNSTGDVYTMTQNTDDSVLWNSWAPEAGLTMVDMAIDLSDPEDLKLTVTPTNSGVGSIEGDTTDDADSTWYNLQGIRVTHPVRGQIYLRVTGTTATKIRY